MKTRRGHKGDWVVMGGAPGEIGHCTRCGEGLRINLPQHIEVVVGATNAFAKAHKSCTSGHYFERPAQNPEQWAEGRDTGISSCTIYAAVTDNPSPYSRFDVPHDPSDFGRCYRLLKLFPAWRGQLDKTIRLCKKWKPFVENWDELTQLYEKELPAGTAPLLYDRIKELGG